MKYGYMAKNILLIILSISILPSSVYADAAFNKICSAIKDKTDSLGVAIVKDRYKGKPLSGKGYVVKVTKGTSGNIVHISTEKNPNSPDAVSVMAFIKKEYDDKYAGLKTGAPINFKGTLFDILLKKMIIKDTEIE